MPTNASTARRFLDALQQLDADATAHLLTEDATQLLPLAASGDPGPAAVFAGRDAVVHVQRVIVDVFSVVEFADVCVTDSDDAQTVFVETAGRRVQRGTGRVYENTYVLKFEFRDGLIARITEYSNPVAFAKFFDQQIG